MDQVKFFKCCLPQHLLGSFLNTLSHLKVISKSFSKFTQFYAIKNKMAFSKVILFGCVKKEVSISVFKSFRIIVSNIIIKFLLNCKKDDKRKAKVSYYSLR